MLVYWLMFIVPAIFALMERPSGRVDRRFAFAWVVVALALIVIIGFRWETGGDWGNYDREVQNILGNGEALTLLGDPAFRALEMIAAKSGHGMLVVTVFSGCVLSVALVIFCLNQPRPWLCLLVAVPYFVVVMGMGYIRQGIAVSLMMLALVALGRGSSFRAILLILIAGMFHSTALVLLPLAAVGGRVSLYTQIALVGGIVLAVILLITSERIGFLFNTYVDQEMSSAGALIRMCMTGVPAAIFLRWRGRFALAPDDETVWTLLSLAALGGCVLILAMPSSTAVDRMGLYLLPVQCFVCARLPDALGGNERTRRVLISAIILAYGLTFFVWLNYADNVAYWLPYRFFFFEDGLCLEC